MLKHYSIKAYGGTDLQLHPFLTSTLDGGVSFTHIQPYR